MTEKLKQIRNSRWFENSIFSVIILAGIIVGLETYQGIKNQYGEILKIFDNIILWIFVLELIVRTGSEIKNPIRLIKSGWYIFDFLIVAICFIPYFFDSFNTDFFVVLRMARVLRMLKLFERVQNLKILLQSLISSLPSMTYVVVLLMLQFYIYAVIGTDLFGKYEPEHFGSILSTMKTLFFVSFEGWSWIYELDGINKAISAELPDSVIVIYFVTFVLLAALVFLNLFIGILTAEIGQSKADESKNQRKIFKSGHTLILGWSQQIFSIIDNLVMANESQSSSSIVILSDKERSKMEDEISVHIPDLKYTKLIFREGSTTNMDYLKLVKPESAKSIIILSQDVFGRHNDINTIKQILALMHIKKEDTKFNIVADIDDDENAQVARSILGDYGCIISTEQMIGKIIAQSAVNSGLSKIYEEIIGFRGSELYIQRENKLIGINFGESMFMYPDSIPIGIMKNDGQIIINPPQDSIYEFGDSVIILSEDDSTIKLGKKTVDRDCFKQEIILKSDNDTKSSKILILGWNPKCNLILEQLEFYLSENSEVSIIAENLKFVDEINSYSKIYKKICINTIAGKIISYKDLLKYQPQNYDHIIILSNYNDIKNYHECDANTILTMINLRRIYDKFDSKFNIAAELLVRENQKLASTHILGDFIVGPDIVSAFISQISEDRKIYDVYMELFSTYGNEFYVKKLENYCKVGSTVNFYTVIKSALERDEIAVGYLYKDGRCIINPSKKEIFNVEENMKLFVIAKR